MGEQTRRMLGMPHFDAAKSVPQPLTRGLGDRFLPRPVRKERRSPAGLRQRGQHRELSRAQREPSAASDVKAGLPLLDVDPDIRRTGKGRHDEIPGMRDVEVDPASRQPQPRFPVRAAAIRTQPTEAKLARRSPRETRKHRPHESAADCEPATLRRDRQRGRPRAFPGGKQIRTSGGQPVHLGPPHLARPISQLRHFRRRPVTHESQLKQPPVAAARANGGRTTRRGGTVGE